MTDPGLKLPLRAVPSMENGLYLYIEDGRGHPVKLTKHQVEVIGTALTADAEEKSLSPAVCRAMARFYTGLADAEKEERDGD